MIRIGPSILDCNLAKLAQASRSLIQCGADYLHLDVMDGHFVPNITFGPSMVFGLREELGKEPFFDLHMMVAKPFDWITKMSEAGASQYTYHYETTDDNPLVIRKIREAGMKVGIAINPETPVEVVLPFIESVDMILVMTVQPGFGGQSFKQDMMPKIEMLRKKCAKLEIGVDGGVRQDNVHLCTSSGATMIVSGSAITRSSDYMDTIAQIRARAEEGLRSRIQ